MLWLMEITTTQKMGISDDILDVLMQPQIQKQNLLLANVCYEIHPKVMKNK